jgi:hypothetical protein
MVGRRTLKGPFAWWLARTYHMSQIPGLRRKLRAVLDWTVSVPFSRDVSEVGSIGHPRPLGRDVRGGAGENESADHGVNGADAGAPPR